MATHHRGHSRPNIRLTQPLPPLPLLPLPVSPVAPSIRIQIPDQSSYQPYHDDSDEEDSGNEGVGEGRAVKKVRFNHNHLPPTATSRPQSPGRELHLQYRDHLSPTSPTARSGISISISRPQSPAILTPSTSQISFELTSSRTPSPTPGAPEDQSKPPEYAPMYDYLRSLRQPIHPFTSPNSNTFLSPTTRQQSPVDFTPYHDNVDHPFIITISPLSPHSRTPGEEGPPSYEELYLQHPCPQRQDELHQLVRQMDMEGNWAEDICKFVVGMILLTLCVVGVGLAFNWGRGWGPSCYGVRC